MNPLPIPFFLPIKKGVLILRSHLVLTWHLCLPSLKHFYIRILFREGGVDGSYDCIDGPEAFSLARFLRSGQTPGDFPVAEELGWRWVNEIEGVTREDPRRGKR